jgi:hypothetical protein
MTTPVTQIEYRCEGLTGACGEVEYRLYITPALGGTDGSARAAGWRIGTAADGRRVVTCPACTGSNPTYWLGWYLDRLDEGHLIAAGLDPEGPDYAEQARDLAEEIGRHDANDDTVVAS